MFQNPVVSAAAPKTSVMTKWNKYSILFPSATQEIVDVHRSEACPPQKDKVGQPTLPLSWPLGDGAKAALAPAVGTDVSHLHRLPHTPTEVRRWAFREVYSHESSVL